MGKWKLGLLGTGFLSGIVADAWKAGLLEDYELVGVMGRNQETTEGLAMRMGCKACGSLEDLLALKPDYVAEAASVELVRETAIRILSSGCSMVVVSIGAFADARFYEEVKNTARANGTKVHIASGAVGGFDVLRTVSLMGEVRAGITTRKGPKSLEGTSLYEESLIFEEEERQVFAGNAKEAIALLPTRVNVAVASALATAGPENTRVNIFSVPGMTGDDHCIVAETEGIRAVVDIYSSTSAIAGWSVVAALQNMASPIVF